MRGQHLSSRHLQLLIALQEGPMDRLEDIAERVKISRTTVSKNLKWLSGESKSGKKRYFRVVPDLNEARLGMHTVDVLFDTPTFASLKKVEGLCNIHAYTKYRARCYGGESGVFAQFRIPNDTADLLYAFLEESKANGNFEDFWVLPTQDIDSIFTVPRLEYWNNDSFAWEFNWDEWFDARYKMKQVLKKKKQAPMLDILTKDDIWIMSLLPRGMRRKQKALIEDLKREGIEFTSQEFSRRYNLIKENFITRYHVYVDVDTFDLYSNVLITADSNTKFSSELRQRLQSNPIPFRSTAKISDDFLFWYLRMPSSHLSRLLNHLHHEVTDLKLSLVDYQRTEVFGLWSEAFDETNRAWRVEPDFMMCRNLE